MSDTTKQPREIKFRAWQDEKMEHTTIDCAYPLMQYTGLKDKNGVEAWEGDIVERIYDFTRAGKPKKVISQIIYLDNEARFKFYREWGNGNKGYSDMYSGHKVYAWEVIGNIYENPELLDANNSNRGDRE